MSTFSSRHAPPTSSLPLPLPHRINRMPSVNELVGAKSMQSPLTQLRVGVENRKDEAELPRTRSSPANSSLASTSTSKAPPLPPIDFNLFRTASVYSVDSVSSMSTVTTDDDEVPPTLSTTASALARPESPTTPKASQFQGRNDYFGPSHSHSHTHAHGHAGPSHDNHTYNQTGPSTPKLKAKSSFVVRSRNDHDHGHGHGHGHGGQMPPVSPSHHRTTPTTQARTITRPRAQSRPEPPTHSYSQIRVTPAHQHQPDREEEVPDYASVHGEQGSDWGDDEQQFEWVDTLNAPEEKNGTGKPGGLSPSKRLSRLKAAVVPSAGDGRRLRKQLTFARRAPPPPLDKPSAPPPVFTEDGTATTPPSSSRTLPTLQRGLSRSARFHANPLRPSIIQPTVDGKRPEAERTQSDPSSFLAEGEYMQVPPPNPNPPTRKPPPAPMQLAPSMVPLKGDKTSPVKRNQSRNSQMSLQSVAYSLYDLDGLDGDALPSPVRGQRQGEGLAFPKGRYTKVKASALELDVDQRTRKISERSTGSGSTIGAGTIKTPEEFVAAGIEARGKGDLAKSAWYFMRATEGGSLTGKMYYGLALRHGWGIAKDEKKAFNLLRLACDETLATTQGQQSPSMDIQQSKGTVKLSLAQKKEMTRDLSLGLFEIANCFLEGSGTKKSPEVALNYLKLAANMGDLASQEQLGFLLSKGGSGVKKDMKEASRWYRMAISSGSSNTIGLAWVWKEKYMV